MRLKHCLISKIFIFAFVLLSASFLVSSSFAALTAADIEENLDILGVVDQQYGFDNNANLESDREKDGFVETAMMLDFTYKTTTAGLHLKAGVDVFNALYLINNVNNFFSTSPYVGFDLQITENLISVNRFIYNHFYTNNNPSNFSDITLSTDLRHYILDNFYHEAGYAFTHRWYPHSPIRILATLPVAFRAPNSILGNEDRQDHRYKVNYNVGWILPNTSIELDNAFIGNNSNYTYQQTYDYWIYRVNPSILHYFTDKFYGDVGFTYEYRRYKDLRGIDVSNRNRLVRENYWDTTASLYYDIADDTTCNVTYTYNENRSRDPFLKYSSSTVSVGISYRF
ncbi:MAG: hypothetical protein ACE5JK_03920 [Candidatus Omnitrophota bacterium]